MSEARHQLTAIMFTDIVGYTALMGQNEQHALSILKKNKEIHLKWLRTYNGKWLKEMGDGVLASFSSVIDAVNCAGAILSESAAVKKLDLRIGIHLGDVVIDGAEIYGDGVNVASRIQGLASVNQLVVSEPVSQNIKNQDGIQISFQGKHTLKNVADPVAVYTVQFDKTEFASPSKSKPRKIIYYVSALILIVVLGIVYILSRNMQSEPIQQEQLAPIRSLAVLPFDNLTGDSSQINFLLGMQDNLITVLSQIEDLAVTSKTSTWRYRSHSEQALSEIALELGVDALIESSVYKADDTFRINVQLVRAFPKEEHLYAETFDRHFSNVLFLYDDVSEQVAREVGLVLDASNHANSNPKTINPEAYKAYANGKFLAEFDPSPSSLELALEHFNRSIELDSTFAPAFAGRSWVWVSFYQMGHTPGSEAIPKIYANNSKALELDPNYPDAQYHKAVISFQEEWDWEKSEKAFQKALELNPNHSMAHAHFSHLLMYQQRFDEAIPHLEAAQKLDPLSPHVQGLCAIVYFFNGDFEKALEITSRGPAVFGKFMIEESNAYLNGEYETSIDMLGTRFGSDSIMFQAVLNAFEEKGYPQAMRTLANSLQESQGDSNPLGLAIYYNRAGMVDDAIGMLEKGFKKRSPNMPYAFVPVEFKNLETDPRYRALAEQMNLPY